MHASKSLSLTDRRTARGPVLAFRLVTRLYDLSPRQVVEGAGQRVLGWPLGPRIVPPSAEFLRSPEYRQQMLRYTPWDGNYGRYEAQTYTRSYVYRHRTRLSRLGVWRWRGLYENLEEVLPLVSDPTKTVIDFGGAGCPLGFHSVVVDKRRRDQAGRRVRFSSLDEFPGEVDVVFACHVLEHLPELHHVVAEIRQKLRPGGSLIVVVPSFSNEGWRAGRHRHEGFGAHVWTFGLSTAPAPIPLQSYANIDEVLSRQFTLLRAAYVGDDSIYCLCRRDGTFAAPCSGTSIW